jgi:hypothetical protein
VRHRVNEHRRGFHRSTRRSRTVVAGASASQGTRDFTAALFVWPALPNPGDRRFASRSALPDCAGRFGYECENRPPRSCRPHILIAATKCVALPPAVLPPHLASGRCEAMKGRRNHLRLRSDHPSSGANLLHMRRRGRNLPPRPPQIPSARAKTGIFSKIDVKRPLYPGVNCVVERNPRRHPARAALTGRNRAISLLQQIFPNFEINRLWEQALSGSHPHLSQQTSRSDATQDDQVSAPRSWAAFR